MPWQARGEAKVERLASSDAPALVDLLCDSFFDYPVMRFVLGVRSDYGRCLETLISLFVAARALRNDPMFGVCTGSDLVAAMTTSNPADPPHPDFAALRAETWQRLGTEAQARYDSCVAVWESIALHRPQLHVNMIGVRSAYRGAGLARMLLTEVHALCDASPVAEGVSLTTEEPRNVGFYERVGYQVVSESRIAGVLPVWNLFRRKVA